MMVEALQFCGKVIPPRSKYPPPGQHRCYCIAGHTGPCDEFPFLVGLKQSAPRVAAKIRRDATMTTGASWKSYDAGPNRIQRWIMMLPDEEILTNYELDMTALSPTVVAKLREKSASYEDCMACAIKLTWLAYGMSDAPAADEQTTHYLETFHGSITRGHTTCLICKAPIGFKLFAEAKRGKATLETSHGDPRMHVPNNVGFAHRDCNIAQGNRTLEEFYEWTSEILRRVGYRVDKS